MNTENLTLKKSLPHGAMQAIAIKTGLSLSTISQVLNRKTRSPKQAQIIKATAEYLEDFKAKEIEASKALDEVLNPETTEQLTNRLNVQSEKFGECISPLS